MGHARHPNASAFRVLIINADDYGEPKFSPAISDGLARRILTSATVLVSRDDARQAVCDGQRLGAALGLHINLTAGQPVCTPQMIRTLVNESGEFLGKDEFESRIKTGMIAADDLRAECAAQLEQFRDIAGSYPIHVDGHHHVQARPAVAAALAAACVERGVGRIRLPIEGDEHLRHLEPASRTWAKLMVDDARRSESIYRRAGLRWPNFMGVGYGWSNATLDRVLERLASLPLGVTEYMVHVARPGDLPTTDPAHRREQEWELLRSQPFRTALDRLQIALGTYADV